MNLPILYTFRRCPYAIRARLGLLYAGQDAVIREISLRDKPRSMLEISPKGTVPVLQLNNGTVIDESRDIIQWALEINDPHDLLASDNIDAAMNSLINENDDEFKVWLDCYKYADRYPQHPPEYYREKAERFIRKVDDLLEHNAFLFASKLSLADIAILPFIRQFAHVDKTWFYQTKYSNLQQWLDNFLQSAEFNQVMKKYPLWDEVKSGMYYRRATEKPMSRLFVALSLPDSVKTELAKVQRPTAKNCRWINLENWHITLQFVGDSDIERVDETLQRIQARGLTLSLTEPGRFGSVKRGVTLWWGVEATDGLYTLHKTIHNKLIDSLSEQRIKSEMPYRPHISLARCKPGVTQITVDDFLKQPPLSLCKFSVNEFALYSSTTYQDGARYQIEKTYRLQGVA